MGLLIAGGLAIVFAIWRGWVAEQQSSTARRQADIAGQNLLNERYQRGAEMLGSPVLSVRMAGIYALQRLAEEHPVQYHVQIIQLLCAFVRNPAGNQESPMKSFPGLDAIPRLREDIQATIDSIGFRSISGINIERNTKSFLLDFRDADLSGGRFNGHNLSGAQLSGANLSWASLDKSDLTAAILATVNLSDARLENARISYAFLDFSTLPRCNFEGANLFKANLFGSDLTDAIFSNANLTGAFIPHAKLNGCLLTKANLSGTDFSIEESSGINAKASNDSTDHGLTQKQLDEACSNRGNPPNLSNLRDAQTFEPLVWRGCSLESE